MKTKTAYIVSILIPAFLVVTTALYTGKDTNKNLQLNTQNTAISHEDSRIAVLEKFFEKYNSPLKGHADTFVKTAEKYNIDYKLLPAISCMESTCGKRMLPNTYNPFGWGIYGKNFIAFKNFDEAIETVGAGLNKGYFAKGLDTVAEIAPIYTPPNSHNWKNGVNFFIYKMEEVEKEHENENIKDKVLIYL